MSDVVVSVHKTMPACCRRHLLEFAKHDRYLGAGEPGDQVRCGCGNVLVYDWRGWSVKSS